MARQQPSNDCYGKDGWTAASGWRLSDDGRTSDFGDDSLNRQFPIVMI